MSEKVMPFKLLMKDLGSLRFKRLRARVRREGDGYLLEPMNHEGLVCLNTLGYYLWYRSTEDASIEEIAQDLCERYKERALDEVTVELSFLFRRLQRFGLVVLD